MFEHGTFTQGLTVANWPTTVCCGVLIGIATGCAAPSFSVVTVPVADVRATQTSPPPPGLHDPLQETQLLYGERVKVLNTDGGWAFIEAVEQAEYTHANAWQGYPGWVRRDALKPDGSTSPSLDSPDRARSGSLGTQPRSDGASQTVVSVKWATLWADASASTALMQVPIGTTLRLTKTDGPLCALQLFDGRPAWIARGDVRFLHELRRLPVKLRRQAVVRAAEQLLGDPYFWGGRSPHHASGTTLVTGLPAAFATQTGVDCSGLVNLAYRAAGIDIPRDAHEQYLRARKITTLHPADVIFLSEAGNAKNIVHVMLYAGDGWLIEGPGTGLAIHRIEVTKRFGRSLKQLKPGDHIGRQTLSFGTYFP